MSHGKRAHTVAVYHSKGGVGKTATAVNLAYLAALAGQRTLLWDLDAQAASSFYFRVRPRVKGGGKKPLPGHKDLCRAIKASDYQNLDILPADFSWRKLDRQLKTDQTLKNAIASLAGGYDLILLDCPPNIGRLSENIFRTATALLIPVIPTTLASRALLRLLDFLADKGLSHIERMPFFSMADRRRNLHKAIIHSLPQEIPGFMRSMIPNAAEVEKMGLRRQPLSVFAGASGASRAYCYLFAEMMDRLDKRPRGES